MGANVYFWDYDQPTKQSMEYYYFKTAWNISRGEKIAKSNNGWRSGYNNTANELIEVQNNIANIKSEAEVAKAQAQIDLIAKGQELEALRQKYEDNLKDRVSRETALNSKIEELTAGTASSTQKFTKIFFVLCLGALAIVGRNL